MRRILWGAAVSSQEDSKAKIFIKSRFPEKYVSALLRIKAMLFRPLRAALLRPRLFRFPDRHGRHDPGLFLRRPPHQPGLRQAGLPEQFPISFPLHDTTPVLYG